MSKIKPEPITSHQKRPTKKRTLTPGEKLFLATVGKYHVSGIWEHATPLEEYLLADSRMAKVRREVLKNSARQHRYIFGIKKARGVYRAIAKANFRRAGQTDGEEKDFWKSHARHNDLVAALSDDDLAIYSTLDSIRQSYGSSVIMQRDSMRIWPPYIRKRLLMKDDPGVILRDRGNRYVIGFCVGMAQHFANLFGQSKDFERSHQIITMDGTIATLCIILFGTAPTRVAIHKMTSRVKPLEGKTKICC